MTATQMISENSMGCVLAVAGIDFIAKFVYAPFDDWMNELINSLEIIQIYDLTHSPHTHFERPENEQHQQISTSSRRRENYSIEQTTQQICT